MDWCVVRLGEDCNWWVDEISDDVNWDVDGLGIIDPKQFLHLNELLGSMTEYGLSSDIVDHAFFTFEIAEELTDGRVRLIRVRDSLLKAEDMLFALPDVMNEEKGPYADFLNHVTGLRVKMLNELIVFAEPFTVDELEEVLGERENNDFLAGKRTHFNDEIVSILEFVPEGFVIDHDLREDGETKKGDDYSDLDTTVEAAPVAEEEAMVKSENLKWEEEPATENLDPYDGGVPDEAQSQELGEKS